MRNFTDFFFSTFLENEQNEKVKNQQWNLAGGWKTCEHQKQQRRTNEFRVWRDESWRLLALTEFKRHRDQPLKFKTISSCSLNDLFTVKSEVFYVDNSEVQ